MSHYEERLEADLKRIRDLVVTQGTAVGAALRESTHGFLDADRREAAAVMLGDHPINRRSREIDRRCHAFVARHVPGAGHLRFVSAVMRMNIALERIGDYAVTIARETAQLEEVPPPEIARDIEMMGDHGRQVLEQAIEAFRTRSADLARGTMTLASPRGGRTFHKVFTDLLHVGEKGARGIEDLFGLLVVLYRLERVGDQVKNLCEDTIFAITGETKQPKVYSILFIDAKNDAWSQMAEAVARKAFPESGTYQSAGWDPAREVDPHVRAFLDARGYDLRLARPSRLATGFDDLVDHHVVVSLDGEPRAHMPEIPFHTTALVWDAAQGASTDSEADLERVHRRLTEEIRTLMETLRGEGAA